MVLGDQAMTKAERKRLRKEQKQSEQNKLERSGFLKKVMTYGVIVVAIALAGWWAYSRMITIPDSEKDKPVDQVLANDWVEGNRDAKTVLVEYSDFQCPACGAYYSVLNQVGDYYGNRIAIVYRNFPLKAIHFQATIAAQAAEAAGLQGKFWEMHDQLFEHQDEWAEQHNPKKYFDEYAKNIGLNVAQFDKDLTSKTVRALVEADYRSGIALRINSTPTFFLNGERLNQPQGFDGFKQFIDAVMPATESATPTASPSGMAE